MTIEKKVKEVSFGGKKLRIETGAVARQATASVIVDMEGTTVMVNLVALEQVKEEQDFFPLRVDYQIKTYAYGSIPGGFFKREGRPSEVEILTARLIDRPIRPLFPKAFKNEVQVVATVLSQNPEVEGDILAMIGTSAALALSGMPIQGTLGAARVGYQDGQYLLNPHQTQLETSELNLVVAGTKDSVLMVESEAKELPESVMLGAVMFGQEQFRPVIEAIEELAKEAGKPAWNWQAPAENETLVDHVKAQCQTQIEQAYQIQDKLKRQAKLKSIRGDVIEKLMAAEEHITTADEIGDIIAKIESSVVRGRILAGNPRIDGRDTRTIRPIWIEPGFLQRTHGSALFTRGETQAIATVTLGSARSAQLVETPLGEKQETFMLHYNFPPYCVGEVGMIGSPKRRDIGHGKLAKRAIQAVLPSKADFPYVLRIVSEITESNGSSSMATVCGGIVALMDAGVPIKAPVAGIAMGLIKEGNHFAILSDILGDEDHLGDMDFKVAGTKDGVTALQMDIKIAGITEEIMSKALAQAKAGRVHILGEMEKAISAPRTERSEYAPQMITMQIDPNKVRDVIGKGGATIRKIAEESGAEIELQDDGTVNILAKDVHGAEVAQTQIELLTIEIEPGQMYEGRVMRIEDFGAFVNLLPGKDGLVHVSQIANHRVENVRNELTEGQMVKVKVLEIDRQGRIRLSMKALLEQENQ